MFKPPKPEQSALPQVPEAPAPPPMFGQATAAGSKPKAKSTQPSFLSPDMVPGGQKSQKTLIGQ